MDLHAKTVVKNSQKSTFQSQFQEFIDLFNTRIID